MIFTQKQEFTQKESKWIEEKLGEYKLKLNRQKSKRIALGERFTFLGNDFGVEQEEKSRIYIGLGMEEEPKFVLRRTSANIKSVLKKGTGRGLIGGTNVALWALFAVRKFIGTKEKKAGGNGIGEVLLGFIFKGLL